jgi:alpha,alpha-trehalase
MDGKEKTTFENIVVMKKLFILLLFVAGCRINTKQEAKHDSPKQLYPGLFEAVQTAHVFADSKTFVDCTPKYNAEDIMKAYNEEKGKSGFDLKEFVHKHFGTPIPPKTYVSDSTQSVETHIDSLWTVLTRNRDEYFRASSLINLPGPYVVPGGRFREAYYWDTYFTMMGLQQDKKDTLVTSMMDNFAHLVLTYGYIPNGNRTYYLTRSQPPFFALMMQLLISGGHNSEEIKKKVLIKYGDAVKLEYGFWMSGAETGKTQNHIIVMPDGAVMNRYYDSGNWPREEAWTEDIATAAASGRNKEEVYRELRSGAESGWDFSSRWLADGKTLGSIHVTDIVPVDLNCLLYFMERMVAGTYEQEGDTVNGNRLREAAKKRLNAIEKYCWDAKTGWYRDYDVKKGAQTDNLNLGGMFPFFLGMSRQGQADSMEIVLKKDFLKPGGLVTTPVATGLQWDAPNGWAPLQYIAVSSLLRYNKTPLAVDIAGRWSHENIKVFKQTGKLLEKYNVVDTSLAGGGGEYPNQDGFGWTNGVLLSFLDLLKHSGK